YVELSDAAYARVQPWPKHDRPTRWVLEVARQKLLELKAQCETRQAMGDSKFSESLELMSFLANLVGIQHISRFIPLADPSQSEASATSQTVEIVQTPRAAPPRPARPSGDDTTREMPKLRAGAPSKAAAPAPPPPPVPSPPPAQAKRTDGAKAPRAAPLQAPAPKLAPSADLRTKIIADAIRLLKWGKQWHELAELIARIAERPPAGDIRKVLRAHKAEIEEKAAQG
ncbi:MAG: hypothetical protein ACREUC_14920, partial [Steroidobacteraceae bacterium]